MEDYVVVTYNCIWNANRTVYAFNNTQNAFAETEENQEILFPRGWIDRMFNVTWGISNEFGDMWQSCFGTTYSFYYETVLYLDLFKNPKLQGWPISALQNLLSKSVYLGQMNVAMYNANMAQNWDELAYLAGRFTRICLIV